MPEKLLPGACEVRNSNPQLFGQLLRQSLGRRRLRQKHYGLNKAFRNKTLGQLRSGQCGRQGGLATPSHTNQGHRPMCLAGSHYLSQLRRRLEPGGQPLELRRGGLAGPRLVPAIQRNVPGQKQALVGLAPRATVVKQIHGLLVRTARRQLRTDVVTEQGRARHPINSLSNKAHKASTEAAVSGGSIGFCGREHLETEDAQGPLHQILCRGLHRFTRIAGIQQDH